MVRNMESVKTQAESVPLGMFFAGFTSSPDMFAPDMIPVTPEKSTPNTLKKFSS